MRALLLALLSLMLLAVVAVAVVPGFIDWQAAKPRLEAELSRVLGRDVAVDGALSLRLLPRPWLTAEGLRVANRAEGSEPELLRVARLEMRVAALPLISGQVEVQSLRLVRPVLLLERLPDGGGNWLNEDGTLLLGRSARFIEALSLEAVELRDAEMVWRDHRAGQEERLSSIDARLTAESLPGPLSAEGRLRYQDEEVRFEVDLGRPDRQERQAMRLELGLPDAGEAAVRLVGRLLPGTALGFDGQAEVQAADAGALLDVLPFGLLPGFELSRPLQAQASVLWDGQAAELGELALSFAEARLEGRARIRPGLEPRLDLDLAARVVELDGLLRPEVLHWPRLQLPDALTGDFTLAVERLRWRGETLRRLELAGRFAGDTLVLDEAGVQLPGSSHASFAGLWRLGSDAPGLTGRVQARSTNLRAQLDWLGVPVDSIEAERLRRFALSAQLEAGPDLVTLSALALDLDLTQITGGLAFAPRARPGLGLRLQADEVNLDAYIAPRWLQQRDWLDAFDANFDLSAERLTLKGRRAQSVAVDGALRGGSLDLAGLRIGDLAGATIQASGRLDGLSDPRPRLQDSGFQAEIPDSARFLEDLALGAPPLLHRLGAVVMAGSLASEEAAAELALDLTALGAAARLSLRSSLDGEERKIESGELAVDDLSPNAAARLLGHAGRLPESDARLELTSVFAGSADRLEHRTRLALDGGVLQLDGHLSQAWSPAARLEADLRLQHEDWLRLAGLLIPEVPTLPPGPLDLEGHLRADAAELALEAAQGSLAELAVKGDLTWSRSAARPRLDLVLETGAMTGTWLSPLLPIALTAPERWRDADGSWSRQPIDPAALQAFDLAADLKIARLALGRLALENVTVVLERAGGRLSLSDLQGSLGAGRVSVNGQLAQTGLDRLALALELEGAALPLAAIAQGSAWGDGDPAGSVGLALNLATQGSSVAQLVAGLEGAAELDGAFHWRNVPEGGEPPLLEELLQALQAREGRARGHLSAEAGVIRTGDLALIGEERFLNFDGVLADLQRQRSTLTIEVRAPGATQPVGRLRIGGPLDALDLRWEARETAAEPLQLTPLPAVSPAPASRVDAAPHRP
ncbi:AsmA family protein [Aquibaculum arenosum]|uniref:AsmA family protein n=1 Tax=Aquibaculum arenosum TaxID=3032591 RepID=A0ABT5YJD6_9PROT|nr:AsmA family protein [Fodinicurvata sp. CAU 1616]MDF2094374.1 AsmA family protein [Fodinicurvata sp. CAU 1616]